jgi:hypothetical protein
MTCILRAGGTNFDVDDFIARSSLVPDSLWRKGEKRFPGSKSSERMNDTSGIRVVASAADFSELSQQIEDVIAFLRQNQEPIRALASFAGVESTVLDFGAEIHPPGWASFTFPSELLLLAGTVGVSLCLSVYPTDPEGKTDA